MELILSLEDSFLDLCAKCCILFHQYIMVLDGRKSIYQSLYVLFVDRFQIPFTGTLVGIIGSTHVECTFPYGQRLVLLLGTLVVIPLVYVVACSALCGCFTDVDDGVAILVSCEVKLHQFVAIFS